MNKPGHAKDLALNSLVRVRLMYSYDIVVVNFLTQRFWHIFIPGFTVSMLGFGFSILGDGIRNILDPEYRFEEA